MSAVTTSRGGRTQIVASRHRLYPVHPLYSNVRIVHASTHEDTTPYEEALRVVGRVLVATVAIEHPEACIEAKVPLLYVLLCPVAKGRSYGEELGMIDASPLQTVIEAHGAMTQSRRASR